MHLVEGCFLLSKTLHSSNAPPPPEKREQGGDINELTRSTAAAVARSMGNCQAAEAAAVVIQHPGGRVERLYWPTSVSEVMKNNPGHHVALVTLYVSESRPGVGGTVRFTRVRLLKPKDTLLLGQVYRLITSQEVTKALRARKLEKLKKSQSEMISKQQQTNLAQGVKTDSDTTDQDTLVLTNQDRQKNSSTQSGGRSSRQWRPSLQSIEEAAT